MEVSSLTPTAFFVRQSDQLLEGKIENIEASRMVVFHPAALLQPNTTYTATATSAL
jgi:hypothetical protein